MKPRRLIQPNSLVSSIDQFYSHI